MSDDRPSQSERRRHFRAGVYGGAVVHNHGTLLRGRISNLSLGGALIDLAEGTEVEHDREVVVELEVGGSGWIAQRGRVRRSTGRQVAIAFDEIGAELEDVIEEEVVAAVEARRSPRVVVVDPREDRRHELAEKLRAAGCTSIEAATPLEAIAHVEHSRNHVAAVAMADTLTQTGPHELVDYLSESNPGIKIAMLGDEPVNARAGGPRVERHGTSDEVANSLAESLRRDRP